MMRGRAFQYGKRRRRATYSSGSTDEPLGVSFVAVPWAACRSADFLFLQRLTGLTKGNLSTHLAKLEEGGLVRIEKGYVGKIPNTALCLTAAGRSAIDAHWQHLERLRKGVQSWQPPVDYRFPRRCCRCRAPTRPPLAPRWRSWCKASQYGRRTSH